jgi:isoamylase
MDNWAAEEGSPGPLGVSWIAQEESYNFAVYSSHATALTLLFYADQDYVNPVYQYVLTYRNHKSGPVWHCRIPRAALGAARYYAYRVEGPPYPSAGHRFDSQKILLDPYAPAVFFPPDFSRTAAKQPGPNTGQAPLGVLVAPDTTDGSVDTRPRHTSDTIIYELHVKGFTRRDNSGVSPEKRGTFAGLVEKIPYLVDLGITAVELLPV